MINHPPKEKSANITLVDIPVARNEIPKSMYNLIPNWNIIEEKY
jgi:hypothetical protein